MIVSIDLGESFFIHAILIVQDLLSGIAPPEGLDSQWLQNFEIHIGESSDYRDNPKCSGGPFMRKDDPNSFTQAQGKPRYWKFGVELWCGMEGQ